VGVDWGTPGGKKKGATPPIRPTTKRGYNKKVGLTKKTGLVAEGQSTILSRTGEKSRKKGVTALTKKESGGKKKEGVQRVNVL